VKAEHGARDTFSDDFVRQGLFRSPGMSGVVAQTAQSIERTAKATSHRRCAGAGEYQWQHDVELMAVSGSVGQEWTYLRSDPEPLLRRKRSTIDGWRRRRRGDLLARVGGGRCVGAERSGRRSSRRSSAAAGRTRPSAHSTTSTWARFGCAGEKLVFDAIGRRIDEVGPRPAYANERSDSAVTPTMDWAMVARLESDH